MKKNVFINIDLNMVYYFVLEDYYIWFVEIKIFKWFFCYLINKGL